MGGNTTIKTKSGEEVPAERIPLKEIGRSNFVKDFQVFLLNMNKEFKKDFGYPIWVDEKEITNGGIFNGSTSFIMSPDYKDDEILPYKSSAGDLDVAVPRELGKDIFNFLESIEGTKRAELASNITYIGNNANTEDKLGNTIICIAKATFGDITVQAQLDLELSDMENGSQTDWSKFAHSSSLTDAQANIKGVAGKHFMRALVGSLKEITKDFIIVSPTATEENMDKKLVKKQPSSIRLLNFSVDQGITAGYEELKGKIDGKTVYRKKTAKEKTYNKNLINLMKTVFDTDKIKPTDLHSFIKLLELTNKHLDKKIKQRALDRFYAILFCTDGGQCQEIEPDAKEDVRLKSGMYFKAIEILGLKEHKDFNKKVDAYVEKRHGVKVNENIRIKSFSAFLGVQ